MRCTNPTKSRNEQEACPRSILLPSLFLFCLAASARQHASASARQHVQGVRASARQHASASARQHVQGVRAVPVEPAPAEEGLRSRGSTGRWPVSDAQSDVVPSSAHTMTPDAPPKRALGDTRRWASEIRKTPPPAFHCSCTALSLARSAATWAVWRHRTDSPIAQGAPQLC